MVVAQHIGRLGNNMFQIAAAIGYARKYGYKWAADEGIGLSHPYSCIHKVFPNLPKSPCNGKKYNEHPNAWCHVHNCHLDLCHFDYHELRDRGGDVTLFGFYQSLEYFKNVQEEVKKVFALDSYEEYKDYTSIHVRRGDYVQYSGSFPPVTEKYLYDSISIIYQKTGNKKFLIFSDDIQWCKDVVNKGIVYYEKFSDGREIKVDDFQFEFEDNWGERKALSAMASCSNHIIANSSFSWWGSYLGHNPDKIVVSPSGKRGNWFGWEAGIKKDCETLIPKEWIQVEFR